MSGMTRYILRQLAGPMLFVTLTLAGVVWLTQSLRFVELIVSRGISAGMFLYLTLLLMPTFLSVILPVALFVAVLYVYARLDSDSEIVVMRSAGISSFSLARPALMLAAGVAVAGYAIALYFMPAGFRAFKELQFDIRGDFASVMLQEGAFNTLAEGVTVYIRARDPNGELRGILVHESRDRKRPATMMAERGALVKTEDGPRLVLVNGNRQEVDPATGQLSLLYFDRYGIDLSRYEEDAGTRWREPGERYLHELLNPGEGIDDRKNAGRMFAEAHKRMTAPLYAFALALIALAAVLGGEFNRRGRWLRIAGAGVVAVLLEVFAVGLPTLAATHVTLIPALYLAVALAIALSGVALAGVEIVSPAWRVRLRDLLPRRPAE